ncbi:MAG: filamentous hemagglutinin N-terminal domain-containing protein, partial [Cyanobacteria bacterium J06649_4]
MKSWPLVSCLAFGGLASGLAKISVLLCCVALVMGPRRSHAQITADTTLGTETSVINTTTGSASTASFTSTHAITGGDLRETTLFHSFEQFSVPVGDTAIFSNADALTHIIGRVTGDNISRLDGTIQAGGRANVFLINPAGIIFGPAAQLQIGGSFFASAGEGVRFDDGFIYSARSPNLPPLSSPLLSVSAPVGLVLEDGSGTVQAIAPTLSVAEGQTLSLSGGNVSLQDAQLAAANGRIEIESLGNIRLLEQSVLDTSGPGGGAIQLQGETVTLSDAS